VQWNTILFQTFIPRTWCYLLEELATRQIVSDIFRIWPPEICSGELGSYCSSLSKELTRALLAKNAAVWPVYEPQNQSNQFQSLESLVVASPTERESVLRAFARVGISLTLPRRDIFMILRNLPGTRILTPDEAHGLLLVCNAFYAQWHC
jgi:hypothetical protein